MCPFGGNHNLERNKEQQSESEFLSQSSTYYTFLAVKLPGDAKLKGRRIHAQSIRWWLYFGEYFYSLRGVIHVWTHLWLIANRFSFNSASCLQQSCIIFDCERVVNRKSHDVLPDICQMAKPFCKLIYLVPRCRVYAYASVLAIAVEL